MDTFAPGGVNTMPMGTLRTGEERRYFFEGGVFLQGGAPTSYQYSYSSSYRRGYNPSYTAGHLTWLAGISPMLEWEIHLQSGSIFQPVMLVYQRVLGCPWKLVTGL